MIFKSEKWQPHVWKNEAFCQKVQQCKSLQKKVFSKIIGSLSNDDGNGNGNENENGKKKMFLDWQNNNFARASCFFCTFLCCCCTTTMWKCLNSCFVENMNIIQRLYFSFLQLWYSLFIEFNSRKIWWIERVEISAIKFEVAWIHFLSDVFIVVAVVVA